MADQASELEALERILSDASAEPTRLSYALIKSITNDFSREIGRGGFGVVYLGILPNGKVAVKKLSISQDFSDGLLTDEVHCLIRAKHSNIVRLLGYCADTQGELMEHNGRNVMAEVRQRLLCFEYVPNGSLQHYLKEKPHRDEWKIRYQIMKGICEGLNYLHKERINHLDLKPENVLLDAHMEPKITDFGVSRWFAEGQSRVFTKSTPGTRRYIAPEIIDKGEISFKSDIFSLGIIVIKLLTGSDNNDTENWHKSIDVDGPQVKSCIEIARTCVDADPHNRPSIGDIIHKLNEMESIQESRNDPGSSIYQAWPSASKELPPSMSCMDNQDRERTKTEFNKLQLSAHKGPGDTTLAGGKGHPKDAGDKAQKGGGKDAKMALQQPTPQQVQQLQQQMQMKGLKLPQFMDAAKMPFAAAALTKDPKSVKFSLTEDDSGSKLDDESYDSNEDLFFCEDHDLDKDLYDDPKMIKNPMAMPPNAGGVDKKGGNDGSKNSGGEPPSGSNRPSQGKKGNGAGDPAIGVGGPMSGMPPQAMMRPNMMAGTGFPAMGPMGHPHVGGRRVAAGGMPAAGFYQGGGGSMPSGAEMLQAAAAAGNPVAQEQYMALIQQQQQQQQMAMMQQQQQMAMMSGGRRHGGAGYRPMGYGYGRSPVSHPMPLHLQQIQMNPKPPQFMDAKMPFAAAEPMKDPKSVKLNHPEDDFGDDGGNEFDDSDDNLYDDDDDGLDDEAMPPNAGRGGNEIPVQIKGNSNNAGGKNEVGGQPNNVKRGRAPTNGNHPNQWKQAIVGSGPAVGVHGPMGGTPQQQAMMRPNMIGGRRWAVDGHMASV